MSSCNFGNIISLMLRKESKCHSHFPIARTCSCRNILFTTDILITVETFIVAYADDTESMWAKSAFASRLTLPIATAVSIAPFNRSRIYPVVIWQIAAWQNQFCLAKSKILNRFLYWFFLLMLQWLFNQWIISPSRQMHLLHWFQFSLLLYSAVAFRSGLCICAPSKRIQEWQYVRNSL